MNKEVKKLWVEALRSGKYKQGKGVLRRPSNYGAFEHCCLGVLCELAVEHEQDEHALEHLRHSRCLMPASVMEWSGLPTDPQVGDEPESTLIGMNDHGVSFAEIAAVIEERL